MTLICLKSQLESLLNKSSHQWFTKNLSGLDFTWALDGRSSCIDHVLFNCKMKEYINMVSVCSTFNDISDHFPLIRSCKKDDSGSFHAKVFNVLTKLYNLGIRGKC